MWIFEHFPGLGCRHESEDYTEEMPRAMRWVPMRGSGEVLPMRIGLDELGIESVIWTPYYQHRVHHPLEDICWYSGYIRCGSFMHAHLPERVLRQFGHVQGIPRGPQEVIDTRPSTDDVDARWLEYGFTYG